MSFKSLENIHVNPSIHSPEKKKRLLGKQACKHNGARMLRTHIYTVILIRMTNACNDVQFSQQILSHHLKLVEYDVS